MSRFDMDIDFLTPEEASAESAGMGEATGGSGEGESQKGGGEAVAGKLEWGQLQDAILTAEIQDGGVEGPAKEALAKRLMVVSQELDDIRSLTDSQEWNLKKMKKLLEIEEMKQRGFSWDRLESGVLRKLNALVEQGRINTVEQLMGVARLANSATRRGNMSLGTGDADMKNGIAAPGGVNIQINNGKGESGLPGPGQLGTITLSLSARTVKQLSTGRVIEGESERILDSVEMLQPEDIPALNQMVEAAKNGG